MAARSALLAPIRNRKLCAFLTGLCLFAAQALLIVHDTAPHTRQHAAECQICVHGAGLGPVLPDSTFVFHACAVDARAPSILARPVLPSRYHAPTARAPPRTASS